MNLKRIFGAVLTILGIAALLYGAYSFITEKPADWKTLIVCAILGIVFFSSGVNLIKNINDKA
jgi:uncharacterized membrane protein